MVTIFWCPARAPLTLRGTHAADRVERGFKLFRVERQRHDVVRACPNQLADECQRRFIGSRDQRDRSLGQFLETGHRAWDRRN